MLNTGYVSLTAQAHPLKIKKIGLLALNFVR
jgi:hypothetical protein